MGDLVKQDINFLEYPLWFSTNKVDLVSLKVEEGEEARFAYNGVPGYVYECSGRVCTQADQVYLYYLLKVSQRREWSDEVVVSPYEVLRQCGNDTSKEAYVRLEDSLDRLKSISLRFKGTFYDGKTYRTLSFNVIDSWGRVEGQKGVLWIRFSKEWLLYILNSNFSKMVDFEVVKTLKIEKATLASRLYEILLKNFQGRDRWEIDAMKLASKATILVKYPAHAIAKIQAALPTVNDKSGLNITLQIERKGRGEVKCIFCKSNEPSALDRLYENESFHQLMDMIPSQYQGDIQLQSAIAKSLEMEGRGFHYIAERIRYTNQRRKVKNYPLYFRKMLNVADLGEKMPAGEQQRIQFDEARRKRENDKAIAERAKAERERATLDAEHKLFGRASHYVNKLSPVEFEKVKADAMKRMEPKQIADLQKGEDYASAMLTHHMAQVVIDEGKVK